MRGFYSNLSKSILIALAIGLGLAEGTAQAQPRRSILLLRLEHPGLSDALTGSFEEAMRVGIKRALPRFTILPAPEISLSALQRAAGCVEDNRACLVSIGRTLNASQVVRVRIEGPPDGRRIEFERVRTRSGRARTYQAELGSLDEESGTELTWHTEKAFGRNPPPLVGEVTLAAEGSDGSLDGAEIRLDGKPVAAGELKSVRAGDREIEVRQIGFEPFVWHGRVRPGRPNPVAVRLVPRPESSLDDVEIARADDTPPIEISAASPPPPTIVTQAESEGTSFMGTWILGSATVVAGAATAVLGVTVLDRENEAEELRLDCEDVDRDADPCASGRRQATLTNIGLGVTAALGVATVAALILEWPSAPDEDDVQLGFTVTDGGAAAALKLTFP